MKISKSHLVLLGVFIIYPFAALPLIIIEVYNRNYYSLYYLAFFMGLLAYLWIPSGDLYRYQMSFELLKRSGFDDFKSFIAFDFLFAWIMFAFWKLNLNFEFIRFAICTLSYILYFKIYIDIINSNQNLRESKSISFSSFLMFFFFLQFSGFLDGVRFTLAMSLCFYAVYLLMYKNRNVGWIILFLSVATHFSIILILLIVTFIKIFKLRFKRIYLILLLVVGFLLSNYLIDSIIYILPVSDSFKLHLSEYAIQNFAKKEFTGQSLIYKLAHWISYCAIYPALLLVLVRLKEYSYFSVFAGICISLSVMFQIHSAFGRYAFLGIIFFIIPFLLHYKLPFTKTEFYFFLLLSFFVYFVSVGKVRRELYYGQQYKILFMPLPGILMSTYDITWVKENISRDGSLK